MHALDKLESKAQDKHEESKAQDKHEESKAQDKSISTSLEV